MWTRPIPNVDPRHPKCGPSPSPSDPTVGPCHREMCTACVPWPRRRVLPYAPVSLAGPLATRVDLRAAYAPLPTADATHRRRSARPSHPPGMATARTRWREARATPTEVRQPTAPQRTAARRPLPRSSTRRRPPSFKQQAVPPRPMAAAAAAAARRRSLPHGLTTPKGRSTTRASPCVTWPALSASGARASPVQLSTRRRRSTSRCMLSAT